MIGRPGREGVLTEGGRRVDDKQAPKSLPRDIVTTSISTHRLIIRATSSELSLRNSGQKLSSIVLK